MEKNFNTKQFAITLLFLSCRNKRCNLGTNNKSKKSNPTFKVHFTAATTPSSSFENQLVGSDLVASLYYLSM